MIMYILGVRFEIVESEDSIFQGIQIETPEQTKRKTRFFSLEL